MSTRIIGAVAGEEEAILESGVAVVVESLANNVHGTRYIMEDGLTA